MELSEELKSLLPRVKGVSSDSREVKEGFVFFAVRGTRFDGHDFVREALQKKALAVVVEREPGFKDPRIIKVEDSRKALAEFASLFYGKPSEKLKVIGVTGTNGKTTTTYLIERILVESGYKTGLMGTIQYRLGSRVFGSGRTTPDPVTWHRTLKEMFDNGATHVVAEVSSHALDQHRVWGTKFEAVVFTNLTQDHLDYHGDMESYYRAKKKLFDLYSYGFAVINLDDTYGRRLAEEIKGNIITYGREGILRISSFRTDFEGSVLELSFEGKNYKFSTNLIGGFQAYNLSAAIGYALKTGIEPGIIQRALQGVNVPGRFEVYRSDRGFIAVVDYAHTPDAIENVLKTIRNLALNKVITVFGAGGNRDRTKRPLMGEVADRLSDIVVVTSDNPRDEEPEMIIKDILKGIRNYEKVIVEPDREKAIKRAVELADKGDIVAILGKGHEDYQEVKGIKYPFSDAQVVKKYI
ncbi:UDP-N-acetylmuramoylalanyl-D-glutamate--2,6-diaminopimelate ligase [Hydrogenivirga caldilitoris]|uniref:UDP-N-acetylmuramoyl-L-alanyl-D-glutamate--2,6-diaminopimelate ligase n=1 Tax=Hydrogenivirga caldilitoris TaxID=246264 RepID=A0A497XMJ8_9AQUI|nr:UDP-N-acetylmuramoyl-L-alanyl-D-glutamate--2,6-diaminopimelate ligase [Hydrogenivirga caldilitoris]RLJ70146.1 UDP-N-acetylmuramoylalanyl-D-glutamate--2,6-diaminopimelate ligase [Hydrogenivirga caldilitoris]